MIILTCPGREDMFQNLYAKLLALAGPEDSLIVCKDAYEKPLPKFKSTAYQNFQDGWRSAGEDCALYFEDDAYLCDNFVSRAKKEISKRPQEIIQFFSRRKNDLTHGSRHLQMSNFSSMVCYYLPEKYSQSLLNYSYLFYLKLPNEVYHSCPSDLMAAEWGGKMGYKYWNVVPNLVQHLGHVSKISPKRVGGRVSKTFLEFE